MRAVSPSPRSASPQSAAALRWVSGAVLSLLVPALVLLSPPPAAVGVEGGGRWRPLLQRAAEAAVSSAYEGELLWVTWSDGQASAETIQVRHTTGELLVRTSEQALSVTHDDQDGGATGNDSGWYSPLPATTLAGVHEGSDLLEGKYVARVSGVDQLLDRDCDVVDVHLRDGGALRERLWIDRASGMLLRRETYGDDGARLRLAAYLSLDMSPMAVRDEDWHGGGHVTLQRRGQDIITLDQRELATLRRAGWTVPAVLPGGYHVREAYAVSADGTQPLQVVYADGLYSVSLFQQRGRLDWSSLPAGAQQVEELHFAAYEWPRAVPERMVWQAGGAAWALVGDAPSEELLRIARALPNPDPPGFAERLRRGLARLWSWVRID